VAVEAGCVIKMVRLMMVMGVHLRFGDQENDGWVCNVVGLMGQER